MENVPEQCTGMKLYNDQKALYLAMFDSIIKSIPSIEIHEKNNSLYVKKLLQRKTKRDAANTDIGSDRRLGTVQPQSEALILCEIMVDS